MPKEEQSRGDAPTPRQKGKGLLVVLAVALVAVSGVCAYALIKLRHAGGPASIADAAAAISRQPALYLPLDPAFVVNFHGQQSPAYLQVGVTLMAHDAAAIDAAKNAGPVVRNALVLLFSNQSYAELSSTAGKQKLREEALQAVQKVVQGSLGRPGIDALYFTSFVMQ